MVANPSHRVWAGITSSSAADSNPVDQPEPPEFVLISSAPLPHQMRSLSARSFFSAHRTTSTPAQRRAHSTTICRATTNMTTTPQQVLAAGSAEPPAGPDRLHPTFITTWSCPYAQRTWIALNAKGIDFTPVFVDLMDKPEWFFKHNPYGRVPTLVWQEPSGQTSSLYESLICNEYVSELSGPSLLPEDPVARARARLIIDQFGVKFSPAFGKVMFAGDDAAAAAAGVEELTAALQWVEGELTKGEGPFFMGKDFTLVDAAVAPFVLRLKVLEGLGSSFKVPTGLPRFTAYCEAVAGHPAVSGSMAPPDSSKSWTEQLVENYKVYVARRKAAAN